MGPEEDGDKKRAQAGADGNAERKLPERRLGEVRVEREKVAESVERREEPFDGWQPSVPKGEHVEYGSEKHAALERVGLKQAKKTAFD